MTNRNSFA